MIGEWIQLLPAVLVGFALLVIPGGALLASVRIRGLALLAMAPIASTAMIAIAAILLSFLGVPWSPLSLAVAVIVFVAVAVGFRFACTRRADSATAPRNWLLVLAVLVGGLFGAWRIAAYIQHPDGISQTNDAVFHLNAVRFILESQSASSFTVTQMLDSANFYPSAWHALVALTATLSGVGIAEAANAITLVIVGLVWTAGVAWLARTIFKSDAVAIAAAVLASALQTFPMLMFQWGVLYPNALSTAMLPAAIALIITLPTWVQGDSPWRNGWRSYVLAALTVGIVAAGIALAQPAGLIPWLLVSLVWGTAQTLLTTSGKRAWWRWAAVGAAWLVFALLWLRLSRSTSGSHWAPFRGKAEVLLDVVLNGQMNIAFAIGISVLMVIGIIAALRHREYWWAVGSWLMISGLYAVVASVGNRTIRNNIFGAWYADPYRIAALAPLLTIPFAAFGLVLMAKFIVRGVGQRDTKAAFGAVPRLAMFLGVVVMLTIVVLRPAPLVGMAGNVESHSRYMITETSYLSLDERALLESLPDEVPADARVLVNPSTGGGFGYVVSGMDVYPHNWAPPSVEDWWILAESLRDAAADPAVCEALTTFGNPEYVLDFGLGSRGGGKYEMPGMTEFDRQPGFEPVASEGAASLWRITACDK